MKVINHVKWLCYLGCSNKNDHPYKKCNHVLNVFWLYSMINIRYVPAYSFHQCLNVSNKNSIFLWYDPLKMIISLFLLLNHNHLVSLKHPSFYISTYIHLLYTFLTSCALSPPSCFSQCAGCEYITLKAAYVKSGIHAAKTISGHIPAQVWIIFLVDFTIFCLIQHAFQKTNPITRKKWWHCTIMQTTDTFVYHYVVDMLEHHGCLHFHKAVVTMWIRLGTKTTCLWAGKIL